MPRRNAPDSAPWITRWSYVEVIVMTFWTPSSASFAGSTVVMPGG